MAYVGPGSGSSSSSGFQYMMNSPFGDTTYTKVFVGGLAWETQSETLRRYFEHFGDILEAVVITDKHTGRSKGYGFVTFREPEAARRACADPTPLIDGRRANCNLASLGRPRVPIHYGRLRPAAPFIASVPTARGPYVGGVGYQQPLPYGYQQGLMYHPYGYTTYGPEYVYPQGSYNPYAGQQYLQIYGVPGAVNTAVYPSLPGGHAYPTMQGYAMPGHQIVQFSGPSVSALTTSSMPTIQAPYATGIATPVPAQPQFIVPAPSPQYMQGSGSDQTTGYAWIAAGLRGAELLLEWRASNSLAKCLFCILQVIHSHTHQRSQMSASLQPVEKECGKMQIDLPQPYLKSSIYSALKLRLSGGQ